MRLIALEHAVIRPDQVKKEVNLHKTEAAPEDYSVSIFKKRKTLLQKAKVVENIPLKTSNAQTCPKFPLWLDLIGMCRS